MPDFRVYYTFRGEDYHEVEAANAEQAEELVREQIWEDDLEVVDVWQL
jgi:hypothetical protein